MNKNQLKQLRDSQLQSISDLESALHENKESLDIIEKALELLEAEFNLKAVREGNRIRLTYDRKPDDIQFSIDAGKTHSVRWMQENEYTEDAIGENEFWLGNSDNINDKWEITIGTGEWDDPEKKNRFILDETESASLPAIGPVEFQGFEGYWDSAYAPDEAVNVWKEYTSNLDRVRGKGKLIPMISGFKPGMSKAKIRERIELHLDLIDDSDVVEFILLMDEPFYKDFTNEDFNRISKIANEYPYKFGWSLADANVNRKNVSSLEKLVIGINTYLFFHEDYGTHYITTKDQYVKKCEVLFDRARKKFPNAEFLFVGQGIKNSDKYRHPPLESPAWTMEFVQNNADIIGILWFEWRDREGWQGIGSMRELYENQKKSFNIHIQ
jgi:hypothetical protein